jgi:hypothetical protein
MTSQQPAQEAPTPPARKPYVTPVLQVYGAVHRLTQNVGPRGNTDGGGGAAAGPKTSR